MPDIDVPSDIAAPAAVTVPIDTSGTATAVLVRGFLFQLVIAAGALVGVMGLGEDTMLVKWIRFFNRQEAIPVIIAISGAIASAWQLIRAVKKHRKFQTLGLLLPQRVAISPAQPAPAVERAATAAMMVIDEPSSSPTKGL